MKHTKVIVFDIYKTLLDVEIDEDNTDAYDLLSLWLSYNGLTITPEDIHMQYKRICHEWIVASDEIYPDIDVSEVFCKIISDSQKSSTYISRNVVENTCVLFRILTTKSISIYQKLSTC